jgi:hypothetical protein
MTARRRAGFAGPAMEFLAKLSGRTIPLSPNPREVILSDFPRLRGGGALKIVTPEAEERLRQGHFRLGSTTYYAQLKDDPRADVWEGYSVSTIRVGQNDMVSAFVSAGYNFLVFCTTSVRDASLISMLRHRFGGRVVKIRNAWDFGLALAESLPKNLTCMDIYIRDVRYADLKMLHANDYRLSNFLEIMGTGSIEKSKLTDVGGYLFESIYEKAILGSVFVKPMMYSSEFERRIAFELKADVDPPYYVDVFAPEAVKFLDFES